MGREWKAGDVATFGGETVTMNDEGIWFWAETSQECVQQARIAAEVRPLVVIDPASLTVPRNGGDSCYSIKELARTMRLLAENDAGGSETYRARVVREVADLIDPPAPPKPDEPQGLGAVVEDADGERYVRHGLADDPDGEVTWCNSIGVGRSWARINGARILSEGVQP